MSVKLSNNTSLDTVQTFYAYPADDLPASYHELLTL